MQSPPFGIFFCLRKGSPQKEWTQMLISKNDPTIPTPAHKLVTSRHTTWHILENSLSIAHKLVTSRDTFCLIQEKSASEWVCTAKGIFARYLFKSRPRYVDICLTLFDIFYHYFHYWLRVMIFWFCDIRAYSINRWSYYSYMWDSNAQFLNEFERIFSDQVLHLCLHQIINFFGRDLGAGFKIGGWLSTFGGT